MKPKQILRFVLVLFILGTSLALLTGIFYTSFIPKLVSPRDYHISGATGTKWGVPFPWISNSKVVFSLDPITGNPSVLQVNPHFFDDVPVSFYTFYVWNFIEDTLLYGSIVFLIPLLHYLIRLVLHWKFTTSLNSDIKQKEVGWQRN